MEGIRDAILSLERRMDQRFAAVDQRFAAIDQRFAGIDQRLNVLDDKLSRYFTWLVGLQVTTLVAVVGALIAQP